MSLTNIYKSLGPKFGNYGKYVLPLSFSKYNTKEVVINTRKKNNTTVFDISHMGVFECSNTPKIKTKLENMLKINIDNLKPNKSKLTVILDKYNNIIDDLIISNIHDYKYRLVVNANTKGYFEKYDFLREHNRNILALQGPGSQKMLEHLINFPLNDLYFLENMSYCDIDISRCGYTGEDGFELYMNNKTASNVLETIISISKNNENINFGGLIARDILRLEAGLNLSGAEFNENLKIPFGAINMGFLIDKKYRSIKKNNKLKQVKLYSDKPIRKTDIIDENNNNIGFITSSNISYNLDKFIALGYINSDVNNKELFILDKKRKSNIKIEKNNFINTNYYKR